MRNENTLGLSFWDKRAIRKANKKEQLDLEKKISNNISNINYIVGKGFLYLTKEGIDCGDYTQIRNLNVVDELLERENLTANAKPMYRKRLEDQIYCERLKEIDASNYMNGNFDEQVDQCINLDLYPEAMLISYENRFNDDTIKLATKAELYSCREWLCLEKIRPIVLNTIAEFKAVLSVPDQIARERGSEIKKFYALSGNNPGALRTDYDQGYKMMLDMFLR